MVDVAAVAVGFARTLRAAGVDASPARVHTFVRALDVLDVTKRRDLYWAGRQTLCGSAEDIARYDAVFAEHFSGATAAAPGAPSARLRPISASLTGGADDDAADYPLALPWDAATRREVLRHRDIAELTPADRELLARLLAGLAFRGDAKRTRRAAPSRSGALDRRRTLRRMLAAGGEPTTLAHHQRRERPRRVVLLVDVSGSMRMYADTFLRFAHTAAHRGRAPMTELFTFGTRLTRVTRAMRHRDPDAALRDALLEVPDWAGGTRVGPMLKLFLDRWGQRGLARGAVVVVLSDGWEPGDVTLLREQMARLQRLAHRVVWANPRAGRPGYAPVAAGMAAALPYIDDFVPGHSLHALEQLAAVVAGASVRPRPMVAAVRRETVDA
ncbi:MAG TPA: VWA domain-containing protein [Mycobacteriales bacterium]|nr:VWA domain-containing protein [Mycobacteriales bacterium]